MKRSGTQQDYNRAQTLQLTTEKTFYNFNTSFIHFV